jgi:hypothetical protein
VSRRRPFTPSGVASALRQRVPGPGRRPPVVQVRIYDGQGHARTLDSREGRGLEVREAAEALLRAAE